MTVLDPTSLADLMDRLDSVTERALNRSVERTRRRELAGRLEVTAIIRAAIDAHKLDAELPQPVVRTVEVPVPGPERVVYRDGAPAVLPDRKPDRRALGPSLALFVAAAYRLNRFEPFLAGDVIRAAQNAGLAVTRDATQAKWWGLIESVPGRGYWRVTPFGAAFVTGDESVLRYRVLRARNEFSHFEGDRVTFQDVVGDPLDRLAVTADELVMTGV